MIFLNLLFLAGLAAVSVPVVLHLLHRSRARPVDWGAMRFLLASLSSRRRRLLLEEVLVLVVRCLLVAALALALARPFLRAGGLLPPWLLLGGLLAGVAMVAVAVVYGRQRAARWGLLAAAAGLLIVGLLGVGYEARFGGRAWQRAGAEQDTLIVLDGSGSMGLRADGRTTFERALEEARALTASGGRGDTFGIVLAGPAPRVIARPTADRRALAAALHDPTLRPANGVMAGLEALNLAAALLAECHSASRTAIVITDGQRAGWDFEQEGRWRYLADTVRRLPAAPRFFLLRLPPPERTHDAALADIAGARVIVGADRPLRLDARLINAGTAPVRPGTVEWSVDGTLVARDEIVKEIPVGAVEALRLDHRFDTPGRHTVTAHLTGDDDLPGNNDATAVIEVLARLPVLLVDGAPAERFFRGAAGFLRVALTPRVDDDASGALTNRASGFLIEPTLVSAAGLERVGDLRPFRAIVLANVARLPAPVARRLTDYVRAGGGLLIAPGRRAEPAFYNEWRTQAGERMAPAQLGARVTAGDAPDRFEIRSWSHPALRLLAASPHTDAAQTLIQAHWTLTPDPADRTVHVGGLLENGRPWLVERPFGRGRMMMTALAFDQRDSNLPTLRSFVPLVHEMIYHLAVPRQPPLNLTPGQEYAVALNGDTPGLSVDTNQFALYDAPQAPAIEVLTPSSNRLACTAAMSADGLTIRFAATTEPGLYRMLLPPALAVPASSSAASTNTATIWPFTVLTGEAEASPAALTAVDLAQARDRIGLLPVTSREALLQALSGNAPGREVTRWLLLFVLLLAVGEIALTRWVAIRRRMQSATIVSIKDPSFTAADAARARRTSRPGAGARHGASS